MQPAPFPHDISRLTHCYLAVFLMITVGRVVCRWTEGTSGMTHNYGFLAIWCDVASEDLSNYRNWLTKEHIADRTFSQGFLGVRLFQAFDDKRSHFILYATASPAVLSSPVYQAIIDNPSPWTQAIMPKFKNFDRAIGSQHLKIGNGFGAYITVWRLQVDLSQVDWRNVSQHLNRVLDIAGVVSVRVYEVDDGVTDRPSVEKTMRSGDEGNFDLLIVAELMFEDAAIAIQSHLSDLLPAIFPCLGQIDVSCRKMFYGEAPHEGPT